MCDKECTIGDFVHAQYRLESYGAQWGTGEEEQDFFFKLGTGVCV